MVHDRMTEQVYEAPAASFKVDAVPAPVFTVPVMQQGRAALEAINKVCYITLCGHVCYIGMLW
jgi:phosphoribosylformylglycinamidine synthase